LVDEKIDEPENTDSKRYEAQGILLESDRPLTAKQVIDSMKTRCSKKHVWGCLNELVERGRATVSEGTGEYGADEYERVETYKEEVELRR
jgi:hypothetical protein